MTIISQWEGRRSCLDVDYEYGVPTSLSIKRTILLGPFFLFRIRTATMGITCDDETLHTSSRKGLKGFKGFRSVT